MIEKMNAMSRRCFRPDVGLLLIRVALGAIFIHHGWMKTGNIAGTEGFMSSIGLPGFMAYAIITVEVLGGAMLILGVLARVAAVATGIAMIVAILLVTFPHKGLAGSEFEILLAVASFGIAFIGAGKYRLMDMFEEAK